jgi:serine/threonine protein kinase
VWNATVAEGPYEGRDVALKIIDLDKFDDFNIDELKKEINIMSQYSHHNLISSYTSFIDHSELCIAMPLIDAGSCLDVLNNNFPNGIEDEAVIATILREVLQGLDYLHQHGEIHRDIKAGNIFAERGGHIHLGDFGVSASLKKGEKRKTFVG